MVFFGSLSHQDRFGQQVHCMEPGAMSLMLSIVDGTGPRSPEIITIHSKAAMLAAKAGFDTKMWALLRSQGAKPDSVSIKCFDTGTTCHAQALSNNLILASYIINIDRCPLHNHA